MKTNKTQDLIMCSLFVALIVVGAFIKIPVPVVPFTLQLLFTMMAGLLLWQASSELYPFVFTFLWDFLGCLCLQKAEDWRTY